MTYLNVHGKCVGRVHDRKGYLSYGSVEWSHSVALMLLQGATVPQATGLMLTAGVHRPVWSSRPGVDGAVFAPLLDKPPCL